MLVRDKLRDHIIVHLRKDYKLSFKNILFHISIQGSSSPENVDFTLLDHYTNIYSKTLVNFSERAVKRMKDDEGSIIFISSPGCNNTEPVRPGYGVPGIFNLHLFTQMKWMCLVFVQSALCLSEFHHKFSFEVSESLQESLRYDTMQKISNFVGLMQIQLFRVSLTQTYG